MSQTKWESNLVGTLVNALVTKDVSTSRPNYIIAFYGDSISNILLN